MARCVQQAHSLGGVHARCSHRAARRAALHTAGSAPRGWPPASAESSARGGPRGDDNQPSTLRAGLAWPCPAAPPYWYNFVFTLPFPLACAHLQDFEELGGKERQSVGGTM